MNHRDKLIYRVKSDTFLIDVPDERIRFDTKVKILECVDKRVFNNITQKVMAQKCNVGVATIKRFESIKVDSLSLFLKYIAFLEHLPNKHKRKLPRRYYSD